MPDEVITFKVVGSQAAIQDFRRTAEAVQGITVETGRAGAALKASTDSLAATRQGFVTLTQTIGRAADVARLFGLDMGGVDRILITVTSTLGTAAAAVRTLAAAIGATLLGPIALFTAAALAQAAAVWKAIEALQRWLGLMTITEQVRAAIDQVRGWIGATGDLTAAIADEVRMSQYERDQAELAAKIRQQAFLEEHRRLQELARLREQQAREGARLAAQAAEEVRRVAEARFQLEAEAIVAFNLWQRDQWQAAADFRKQKFLEEAAARTAALALEIDDIVRFNIWQRQQWEAAAAQRRDAFMRLPTPDPGLRSFADQLAQPFDAMGDMVRSATDAVRTFTDAWSDLQERLSIGLRFIQVELVQQFGALGPMILDVLGGIGDTVGNFFGDLVRGAKSFGQSVADFFSGIGNAILNMVQQLISSAAVSWLLSLIAPGLGGFSNIFRMFTGISFAQGGIAPGGFMPAPIPAFQAGGIVRQPTLGIVGEGGRDEAIVPLQSGRIPVELTGGRREQEVHVHIYFDRSQMQGLTSRDVIAITVNDFQNRGPIHKMVRAAIHER